MHFLESESQIFTTASHVHSKHFGSPRASIVYLYARALLLATDYTSDAVSDLIMSSECETSRVEQLELESTVGFNGKL